MNKRLILSTIIIGALGIGAAAQSPRRGESGKFEPYDNMALLYGGNMARDPAEWTRERLRPHVTYTDRDGREHWLFDAFLALEIYDRPTKDAQASALGIGYGERNGDKANWTHFLDYWFAEDTGLGALNAVVGEAKARLGEPSRTRKVVISIPDPIPFEQWKDPTSNTVYWGEIDGRKLDFAKGEDRASACKWFVDEATKRFKEAGYDDLTLEGFYCFSEELVTTDNGYNPIIKRWEEVYPAVSDYVHSLGMSMSWIPYNWATGSECWQRYHFDFVMIQPNYLWHPEYSMEEWKDRLVKNNLSMELEIDDKVLYGAPDWEKFRERFYYYFQMCKDLGLYGNCVLSYYMGSNTLYKLSTATNPIDIQLYNDFCTFILGNQQH